MSGDICASTCDAIVNPVNCKGVMGKGLALIFKRMFPDNYTFYRDKCVLGDVRVGEVCVYVSEFSHPKYIVNFPTKDDWRQPSEYRFIQAGLQSLRRWLDTERIESIAIPALGCGLGGLEWCNVEQMIKAELGGIQGCEVYLYAPIMNTTTTPTSG